MCWQGRIRKHAALPGAFPKNGLEGELRKNDYPSFHTQDIVQGADIAINARLGERDTEASHSQRCLCESGAVLGSCLDKAGVHTVGRGIEHAVPCAIGVNGYIGGRINKTLRFGPEGDSVCCDRIFVGPFYRVARMNCNDW